MSLTLTESEVLHMSLVVSKASTALFTLAREIQETHCVVDDDELVFPPEEADAEMDYIQTKQLAESLEKVNKILT